MVEDLSLCCVHVVGMFQLCCSVCVAVCCNVLQCVVVCCSVLQCVAICCSVLQCAAVSYVRVVGRFQLGRSVLKRIAAFCSVLQ